MADMYLDTDAMRQWQETDPTLPEPERAAWLWPKLVEELAAAATTIDALRDEAA